MYLTHTHTPNCPHNETELTLNCLCSFLTNRGTPPSGGGFLSVSGKYPLLCPVGWTGRGVGGVRCYTLNTDGGYDLRCTSIMVRVCPVIVLTWCVTSCSAHILPCPTPSRKPQ